ncbi:hypothetical protein OBE_01689 [human gut metagenome]|uniref:Uncharacterized protein n=1 Tax=human gut metagenome TaxID=408170 RepID=K1U908_9ZZZZ
MTAVPWSNIGAVRSFGGELSVNYKHQFSKDWLIDIRGNFTYVENNYDEKDEPRYNYEWEKATGTPMQAMLGIYC